MTRPAARPDDQTAQRYLHTGWQLVQTKLGYDSDAAESSDRRGSATRSTRKEDVPEFPLLGLIGPTEVISDDETTGGFYRRWDTKADYLADLVRYILNDARMKNGPPEQRSLELLTRLIQEKPTFGEFVHTAARTEMDALTDDPAFAIALHLWPATRTHPWVRDLMAEGYAESTGRWSQAYQSILSLYGMTLRRGFDEQRLAVLLTALLDGLALRRGVEPEAVDDDLFPEAVLALLLGLLQHADNPEDQSVIEAFDEMVGADQPGFVAAGRPQHR
jgi:hypothetical protein